MSSIRIAHVVEATTGGVARHVIDLATHLDPDEFTCLLYLSFERPESWKDRFLALRERGICVREIPMHQVPNSSAVRQLAGWIGRDAVDLLHLHSARAGFLGRQAGIPASVQVIYTPHAFPFQRNSDVLHPLYRVIERRLAARAAKIVCVSAGECREAYDAGLPADKLVVIPNGIDLARWPRPTPAQKLAARRALDVADDEVLLGAMARLVTQKGIDLLVAAMVEVQAEFRHARLIIWGDGPQRPALERMARRLRLRRVAFAGETAAPWEAYAAMDIFCAPSRWEGGPYAILEAMACGLPVVASEVAGHTDYVVDEVTGRLVTPDLPGPIAGALRNLIADEDFRSAFGDAGRQRVEDEFTLDRMIADTAALYRSVLLREAAPPATEEGE